MLGGKRRYLNLFMGNESMIKSPKSTSSAITLENMFQCMQPGRTQASQLHLITAQSVLAIGNPCPTVTHCF